MQSSERVRSEIKDNDLLGKAIEFWYERKSPPDLPCVENTFSIFSIKKQTVAVVYLIERALIRCHHKDEIFKFWILTPCESTSRLDQKLFCDIFLDKFTLIVFFVSAST